MWVLEHYFLVRAQSCQDGVLLQGNHVAMDVVGFEK
jgi:hypothetical protein